MTNEEVVTFDTKYQGQDVKTAVYSSEYKNTPTTFEFTKTDITSGAELSGATLTVLDKDGNVVDTWTSDAKEAHVIKKLVVGETYTLREEFAPYGYLKATDIQFTVEDTGDVQHVEMKDEVATGSIVINKDGEFVTDTTLMKGHWYDFIFPITLSRISGILVGFCLIFCTIEICDSLDGSYVSHLARAVTDPRIGVASAPLT